MIKKAMIMAAGVGSRLDPLTQTTPKPLIPIANQVIMDLILNHLHSFGVENVVANTHCLAENISERYANSNPTKIKCNFVYETELSGTAGGIKKCEWFFEQGESFIVMSGDGLTNVNLEKMYKKHKASGAIATIGLTRVLIEEVPNFGVVVTDENSIITEFQEKPTIDEAKSNLVNTGIYIFGTEIFNYIPENEFCDFAKNVFPAMMKKNESINTYVLEEEYWSDIGTLNQYRLSTMDVLKGKTKFNIDYPESELGWCAKTSKINSKSVIEGKVVIGEGTVVEDGAKLYGYNVIGNNCIVKNGSVIKNSIIWNNIVIENNVEMEDCIIANNTVIEKNMKLDKSSVIGANLTVQSNGELIKLL